MPGSTHEFQAAAVPRYLLRPRLRPARPGIPQTAAERGQLLQFVRHYVAEYNPVPPLPLDQLHEHADRVIRLMPCDSAYRDYLAVLINNEIWREALATVPYSRRLLLLPKCLRAEAKCPASFDAFGLLCRNCGLCTIPHLQGEAEALGYAVLVAEGAAVVTSLIQTGKIDAIIGVSCLGVLQRAFPYMEAAAVPGVAIPLLQDDCADTTVDLDWVWDYIHLTSADSTRRLDLGALREEVDTWFEPRKLEELVGPPEGAAEEASRRWLTDAGRRWRPFLAVAAYQALRGDPAGALGSEIQKLAVAVESFHKASLIHDDIEDGDAERYGKPTLHEELGIPQALNAGDLLIGEGYRLIACSGVAACETRLMIEVAAQGQRQLCRGQGAELAWARQPNRLSTDQVLDIFRQKTAPAFEVALHIGLLCASAEQNASSGPGDTAVVLKAYSAALGIAYQIRDDLEDFQSPGCDNDLLRLRPTIVLALACERATGERKAAFEKLWCREVPNGVDPQLVRAWITECGAIDRAQALLEAYKQQAIRCLAELQSPNLKGLLRRVIGRIFNEAPIRSWCKEFERHDHDGSP